jgi:hypothetical protein
LGYVGADYGGAVAAGAVTNEDEYKEQLSLLEDGAKIAQRIAPARSANAKDVDVPALVARVRKLVDAKAAAADVEAAGVSCSRSIVQFVMALQVARTHRRLRSSSPRRRIFGTPTSWRGSPRFE